VKEKALQCIDDASYLEVWKESDPTTYKKRKAVLEQLKDKLLHEVNPPRKVDKCPLYYREKTKYSIGDVFSYTHENGNISYIEVVRIEKKPVSKLAPELDFQSASEFALIDTWSTRPQSLEELSDKPYRRFFEEQEQKGRCISAYTYDLIKFNDETFVHEKLRYMGKTLHCDTKQIPLFQSFSADRSFDHLIESTFSLPYSISNQMLNGALSIFLQDARMESFEDRIRREHPEWPIQICKALKKVIIMQVQRFINDVHVNHAIKNNTKERDENCLKYIFPWVEEQNAKHLRYHFIPRDEKSTMTELGKTLWNLNLVR